MASGSPVMFDGVNKLESELKLSKLRPMRNSEGNLFLKSMVSNIFYLTKTRLALSFLTFPAHPPPQMPLNTVMFRGHTLRRDATSKGDFKVTQNGRGHWG